MNLNQEKKWLLEEKYGSVESEAFHTDLKRLVEGEPLAYIIGCTPFLNCEIYLDSRPLIPRPETEYWTEKAITVISSSQTRRNMRVLDLCAGSGCVGVAVSKAVPEAQTTFVEIDDTHLPTIKKNLKKNIKSKETSSQNLAINRKVLAGRFNVIQSDLFKNVSGRFDFILTNPPYIDPLLNRTESSVKNYEPHQALYGGKAGLDIINDIITQSPKYLTATGQLWIEHEPEQVESIQKCAEAFGFSATTHQDQYGVERYSILTNRS